MSNDKLVQCEEFLQQAEFTPILDIRAPSEFAQGHIPGAINMPLFSDEERAKVGTAYKKVSKEEAILIGLDIVGPKLSAMVKQAKKVAVNNKVLVYCWRGGMRSESVAWLLSTAGLKVKRLSKGYKAYRAHIRSSFAQDMNLVVMGGMTGSGKTDILLKMLEQGQQVLDLEGYANHKGSVFGTLGQQPQPTSEQFENDTYEIWKTFDFSKPIWVEDESKMIGHVAICDPLFKKMRNATVIKIEAIKQHRIDRLIRDYTGFDDELLRDAIHKIEKRLGGQNTKACYEALDVREYSVVADIALKYYDKAYLYGLEKRDEKKIYTLPLESTDPVVNARKVTEFYSTID
jgi:tRNA 2-selenouridine synthase